MKHAHTQETDAGPGIEGVEGIRTKQENNYIDPNGYWIDSGRNVRRMGTTGGEQLVIVRATPNCSDAEWKRVYDALVACLDTSKA
jgi:hypothetical protein